MCGIVGFLGSSNLSSLSYAEQLIKIKHRGPDSDGSWFNESDKIWLGHRRLAIVDLSVAGQQPMVSPQARYVIVFNGEIYNHQIMRDELNKQNSNSIWRGTSDTETLLAGFEAWGIESTLKKSIGMFAFAVWDKQNRALTLGRDRIGEKPLYFGWQGLGDKRVFMFGSELKALKGHPDFDGTINRDALALYMRHNCIPAPYSIYQGINKLEPGHLLTVSLTHQEPKSSVYWSAAEVAKQGALQPFAGSDAQAIDALENLLKNAVGQQMMADVPLGAFLSGGIDSSTVVSLMQAQSSQKIKTFSIGFDDATYNEAESAKAVATHLGTDHTELYVTSQQAQSVIPLLPSLYDEPFADSSQIPTYLVSQLAKQHVTVSLSGDAGDELFCGYNRYMLTDKLWRKLSLIPSSMRKFLSDGIMAVSPHTWNQLSTLIPGPERFVNLGDKLHKGAGVLTASSVDSLYRGLVSHWPDPTAIVLGSQEPPTLLTGNMPDLNALSPVQRMMTLDMLTYLPDDILTKVDRAAMGVSLESRVPFLDHRVVEFASSLPQAMKLRGGQTKWVLRQVLYRHVPKALIERPKMGFGIPIYSWLRGPLREWAEDLLNESRLQQEGFFDPTPIRKKWAEHLSGRKNWHHQLWDVLMFQAWLENEKATA